MKKLSIILDFDDTVVFFSALWARAYSELFPDKPRITTLDVDRYALREVAQLTHTELERTFLWVRSRNYPMEMPVNDRLVEHWINRMRRDGHSVKIVTANPPETIPNIRAWCDAYGILDIEIISVPQSKDKLDFAFDVIVEDHPTFVEWLKNDKRQLILYATRHNKSVNKTAKRVALNWSDVYRHVSEIANE